MTRTRTEFPAALYAAAGAGEIAYQRLRRLPAVAARTAGGLRQRFADPDRDVNVDLRRVRESAQRATATLVAQAATYQDRATAGYRRLVARGEQVVADRLGVATGQAEPVGIEVEVGPVQPAERPGTAKADQPGAATADRPAGAAETATGSEAERV